MSVIIDTARWSRGGYAKTYPWPQCRYCGRAQDHDCKPVTCPVCESRACFETGSECRVCYVGLIPGWSTSGYDDRGRAIRECGYARCEREAIAKVPRVGRACREHLGPVILAKVAARIAHRDSGKGWEYWRWVE